MPEATLFGSKGWILILLCSWMSLTNENLLVQYLQVIVPCNCASASSLRLKAVWIHPTILICRMYNAIQIRNKVWQDYVYIRKGVMKHCIAFTSSGRVLEQEITNLKYLYSKMKSNLSDCHNKIGENHILCCQVLEDKRQRFWVDMNYWLSLSHLY